MHTPHPFPSVTSEAKRLASRAYTNARANVQRLADAARGAVQRLGVRAEALVGAKIKRRVKPPIVAALVVAGAALVLALIAVFRK